MEPNYYIKAYRLFEGAFEPVLIPEKIERMYRSLPLTECAAMISSHYEWPGESILLVSDYVSGRLFPVRTYPEQVQVPYKGEETKLTYFKQERSEDGS